MSKIVRLKTLKLIDYPVGTFISYNTPIIKNMASYIKRKFPEGTISLWCRGSSGAIIAGIISSSLKRRVDIRYISKNNEKRHDKNTISYESNINIIVDDFICTGETIDDIIIKSGRKKFDLLIVSGDISEEFIKSKSWNNIFEIICCEKINKNIYEKVY